MDWQQLIFFHAIVRFGSVTRAAEAMFRTQSALSQQLSKLESFLGCKLFERIGKNKLKLTEEGELIYKFVDETVLRERSVSDAIDELKNKSFGSVYIAAPYAILCYLIIDEINAYISNYPNVKLHIFERPPQRCLEMLEHGEVDFCFAHHSTISEHVSAHRWKKGTYMIAAHKSHPILQKKSIELSDVLQYPLNLPSSKSCFSGRDKLDKLCAKLGYQYSTCIDTSNIFLSLRYAERGIGVSFLIGFNKIVSEFSRKLTFISLSHIFQDEYISIVMRKNKELSGCKKEFISFFQSKKDDDV